MIREPGAGQGLSPEQHELLRLLLAEEEGIALAAPPAIPRRAGGAPPPLSFAQQRLWFLHQLEPASPVYNVPLALRLAGPLDLPALAGTLAEIVRRHEGLRTTFGEVAGQPVQIVHPPAPVPLPQVDLESLPAERREVALRRCLEAEFRRPFDLAAGPLLRVLVVRMGPAERAVAVNLHHVVADGWSLGVMLREIEALYAAALAASPSPLAELSFQYADFAVWQRGWLTGERLAGQLAFWRQRLADLPVLQLPADHRRGATLSARGVRLSRALPFASAEALRACAARHDASLFMVLLAGFAAHLHRLSGQRDLAVGAPIANRRPVETEALIGYFANTLVLRADAGGDPPFGELLTRVRAATLAAYDHAEVPFELLVEELAPERDLGRTPLFQVALALQNAFTAEVQLPGLQTSPLPTDVGTAKFELTLFALESRDGLTLGFEASRDLFERATVERMLGQLVTLLIGAASGEALRLSDLPLLDETEREQIRTWSRARRTDFPVRCLHAGFAAQAASRPEAIAVEHAGAALTYGELERHANRLARRLRGLGVGPEARVGLCLDRSLDLVVAILATLKAGGAYVPLDPDYPQERLEFLLADAAPAVLLTDREGRASLPPHGAALVLMSEASGEGDDGAFDSGVGPDHAAYVIYTSGSTGKPKGVVVPHGQVARLFSATDDWFGFGADDVWTLFHSYAFDFSVWEIWGALLHGGRLVVVPYLLSRSPEELWGLLARQAVTVLNQTPSAFRLVSRAALADASPSHALRWVVFGGEALDLQSLAPWFARFGDARPTLVNMYGITETTVHVTFRPLTAADAASPHGSRIGRAIPDLEMQLLGPGFQPVPVGVPGELHVGGAGLARGYLDRPELTAQRFVPNPAAERGGERLYRSGDLARFRPDGDVEYLGRADAQVKLRGFRIELGEIEAALAAQPGVAEAVVLLREDIAGEPRLVGYAVPRDPRDGAAPSPAELRRALQAQLPEPMVPAALVILPALPRTAHGKLDRRALPEPQAARREVAEDYVAPRGEAEEILAGIWSHVLGVERVGARDRFFALGGDSIRSVRVAALARQRGLDLSLPLLFQHQTIAELAAAVAAQRPAAPVATPPFSLISEADRARLPGDVEDAYPLTRLQAGMLLHMRAGGAVPLYHNVDTAHLRGALAPAALRAALQEVVARHPMLRTSFALGGFSEPVQLVHRQAHLPLPVIDLTALDGDRQQVAIDDFVAGERRRLLDLTRPPLIRFCVHRRSAETFQVTLTECHAIFDGWSLHTTLEEIFARAFARQDGEPFPPAPPPQVSFRDYVALERAALASSEAQAYWQERLSDFEPTLLPRWPAGAAAAPARMHRSLEIPPADHAGLRRLERQAALPFKSLVLAVHLKVLALLSARTEVTTGLVLHGRPEELGGEDVRGLFLNTLPFRVSLPEGSWRDLASAAFEAERQLLPHRRYPLAALQAGRPGVALFEAAFNYVHFHVVEGLLGSGRLQVLDFRGYEDTNFLLVAHFRISLTDGRPFLTLEADATRLPPAQIESLGRLYCRALAAIAAEPEGPHAALSPFDAAERTQVLGAWVAIREPALADRSIPDRFAKVAAARPTAEAVSHGAERLTYAELDAASNQLARHLRALGVGPEVPVALVLERSPALVIAVLAVLKAGGFYVPLDPRDPAERREGILADLAAGGPPPVLLTDELLARERAALAALSAAPLPLLSELDSAAYAIHTSGSTGRPKGVVITHRNVLRLQRATEHWFGFGADDVWPLFHSYAFDVSVWEIWGALLYGGRLVIVPFRVSRTPEAFGDLLRRERVTVLNQTPSAFLPLIQAESQRTDGDELALKWVVFAGEALDLASLAPWWRLRDDRPPRLVNMYGITETTVHVTWREIAPREPAPALGTPVGVPMPDLQIFVVDSRLEPVPLGVPGEGLVGGAGLARGYLRRPDLTALRFVPHPFSDRPGERLYRSGDLMRWRPDGQLEAFGRIDQQVKVRGHRVELGEIEAALARHPAVRACVVLPRKERGETRLAAFVVGDPAAPPSVDELRRHLRSRLPEPMVPAQLAVLDALPLTRNGKVDRAALAAMPLDRRTTEVPFVAPRSEIERRLAAVWQAVLRLDRVGTQDNFFDLGGSSITLLQVHQNIEEVLRRRIPITLVMEKTTIGDLARALAEAVTDGVSDGAAEGEARARQRRERLGARRLRGTP